MGIPRRTALSVLGIAAAGQGLAAEHFLEEREPGPKSGMSGLPVGRDATNAMIAKALRNLADAVERKEISVQGLTIGTEIARDAVVKQRLNFDFILPIET